MGTFMGHFLPGMFFASFAVWWCVKIFQSYYTSLATKRRYTTTLSYPFSCCCGHLKTYQMEGILIIFVVTVGITGEVITGIEPEGFSMGNAQHVTMFFAYGLCGLVSLLEHHKLPMLLDGALYGVFFISTLIEAILFNFHVHGRNDFDKHMHFLLVYTVCGCSISLVVERIYQHSPMATLARTYFFLLQGTWFIQIGYTLYNPFGGGHWDVSEEKIGESIMIATLYFAWHMLGIVIAMGFIGAAVYLCCRKSLGPLTDEHGGYQRAHNPLLHSKENGKHQPITDSDSEVDEFSQV